MTKIRLIVAVLGLVAALVLAACGGGNGVEDQGGDVTVSTAKAEGKASGDLTISNWALYIDKQTIPDFEDATGIKVDYVEDINSYDEFFGKMQPILAKGESGGRSLMVAGDWLAKKMYDLGYIQKLDKQALAPAFKNLSPTVKAPSSDPNWDFSIPWQGGMTGLIVNTEEAPDVHSINDLWDPKYKGRVEVLTELREAVPLVMKADGIDPDTATKQDWLDAIDKLKQEAQSGQIRRFTGGDYAKDLVSGDAVAVMGWAADAIQLAADNPNLQWRIPTDGCMVWWDDWVIPVGAPNPTAAYKWINYTYEPKNQAQIDAWTSSVTPVAGVKQIFEKTDPAVGQEPPDLPEQAVHEELLDADQPAGQRQGPAGCRARVPVGDRRRLSAQRRTATRPAASTGRAADIARRAPSSGAVSAGTLSSRTVPSASRCSPCTDSVRRRRSRAGVESRRWATLRPKQPRATAAPAIASPALSTASAFDHQPVRAGNAPQVAANQKSVWKRPPKSSRL